jgi:hypothetical protein
MQAFWIGLIVLVPVCYVILQRDVRKVRKILDILAIEHDGQVRNVFGSYPQLRFQHDGNTLLVSAMPGSSATGSRTPQHTFAQFYLPAVPESLYFRIRSRSTQTAGEQLFGLKDKQIGDAGLDDRFVIETEDEDRLRELLSPETRERILRLSEDRGIHVSLGKVKHFNGKDWVEEPRLNVSINRVSTSRQDYVDLIDTALDFLARINKARGNYACRRDT